MPAVAAKTPAPYTERDLEPLLKWLGKATMDEAVKRYLKLEADVRADDPFLADLGRADLFYLLLRVLHRDDIAHPWLYTRCREVEESPDGHLDLWAREHYKSTIITFGLSIQDILRDPEVTIGIFSHTRPIAKGFLRQIKVEFETNDLLKTLYPSVLWADPKKEAPKWSEDEGIVVKRQGNPKEATVEAWGLVDGQPTSKHFREMVYDDVVTQESVTTPDMIKKVGAAIELSYNLGAEGGLRRFIGTRYHYNDTYRTVIDRGTARLRLYDGTVDNSGDITRPALWSKELMAAKRRDYGIYTFGTQILQNPKGDETQGFKREWLRHYKNANSGKGMNKYILVDPAHSKKKTSDYTAMLVIGLGRDGNYYVLDMVRDRLSLAQRCERLIDLHKKWDPLEVRYESYGLQADTEHIEMVKESINYRFRILEVGGAVAKPDRIKRLIPIFEQGKMWLPTSYHVADVDGEVHDLVHDFIEDEYAAFPVGLHDDLLDCMARIVELGVKPDVGSGVKLKWPGKPKTSAPLLPTYAPLDPGIGM